jgi:hypothetical protein
LIDIYRKTFPDHSGIIPVYLLFDFVMQVERREKAVDRSFTTRLQVIRNQRAATVDEGWLKQTRDMRIYWSNIHDDLLSRFEKSLQEAIQRNFVHEDELAASAGEYVSELRARRDSLLEQSLNEERSDINFEDGE